MNSAPTPYTFEVGDRVRVRPDARKITQPVMGWVPAMDVMLGREFTVDRITRLGRVVIAGHFFQPEALEPISDQFFDYLTESERTVSDQFHGDLISLSEVKDACEAFIQATAQLDRIKKLLFYGEDASKGRFGLSEEAGCGNTGYEMSARLYLQIKGDDQSDGSHGRAAVTAEQLIHAVLGTATEAGEMIEHLYDVLFEDKPLDMVNLAEEVFDGQWYHAILCRVAGITFDQGQRQNIEKLRIRYPDKLTSDNANDRDLTAEREALEAQPVTPLADQSTMVQTLRELGYTVIPPDISPAASGFTQVCGSDLECAADADVRAPLSAEQRAD